MSKAATITDQIFWLLRRKGPQTIADIAENLLLSEEELGPPIDALQEAEIITGEPMRRESEDVLVWRIAGS